MPACRSFVDPLAEQRKYTGRSTPWQAYRIEQTNTILGTPAMIMTRDWPTCLTLALSLTAGIARAPAEHPLLSGYLDQPALTQRVQSLSSIPHIQSESLGTTRSGHEIHLLTVSDTEADANSKPAILIIGGIDATRPVGTEMAIRLAEGLAKETDLIKRNTFYVIPQANPDGSVRQFQRPYRESAGNGLPTDDDRDGTIGEDPAEDLDGDGFITSMRVYRSGGAYRPDEKDPRVNVAVAPGDEKAGEYDLFSEGIDNDQDESWNEDASDGVDLNRNFTFEYAPFARLSGPHAVSEVESRAIADFAWDHPNIVMIFCLGPPDNLSKAWTAEPARQGQRIITSLNRQDAPYFGHMSKIFSQATKPADMTGSTASSGDLLHWSYYHFGRWALGTPSWGFPSDEPKPQKDGNGQKKDSASAGPDETEESRVVAGAPGNVASAGKPGSAGGPPSRFGRPGGAAAGPPGRPDFARWRARPDRRDSGPGQSAQEDPVTTRRALKWMDEQKIAGFSPWMPFDHPDFPNQRVEIGGIRPWWQTNPPASELDALAATHQKFLVATCQLLPALTIDHVQVDSLGKGVLRVTVRVANSGYLPTSTHHGAETRLTYPVQVELDLPEGAEVINGSRRRRSNMIDGGGSTAEHTWLIRTSDPPTGTIKVRASCIMIGTAESLVPLVEGA